MGKLILPENFDEDHGEEVEEEAERVAEVNEDWELLARIMEQQEEQFPDDTAEERELRLEMALTRHVNQQKVMGYSRINEVNPMAFLNPNDLQQIYIELILDLICQTVEDRLSFELSFEVAVQEHVDRMGAMIAQSRARALDPEVQGQMQKMNRQQRRDRARELAKLQSRG